MNHQYHNSWDYQNRRIIDCLNCGFKHIDPLPDEGNEDFAEFYRRRYHVQVKPFPYDRVDREFIAAQFKEIETNREYAAIFNKVAALLPSPWTRKMVDIGCGNNLLLVFFQKAGWQVCGIEPSRAAATYLRRFDLEIHEAFAEEIASLGLREVSFVNLQFVLEHIREPLKVLPDLYRIMAPGGLIRISVPNDFSEGQLAYLDKYREKPGWVYWPDHINYFTFETLSRLLTRTGFKEIYRTANFPLEFLLLSGLNYYADEVARAKVGPLVANFEAGFTQTGREDLLCRIYENLARLGMGRSIFMYAVKV